MSLAQLILLAAILLVFIAWRRARTQVTEMKLRIEEHRAANTFTIEPVGDGDARALAVLDGAGTPVDPQVLDWDEHGLQHVIAQLEENATAVLPGTRVELIDRGDVIEVWSAPAEDRLGRLDAGATARVRERLAAEEVGSCVVMRQAEPGATRLELLLIHAGVDVEL